MSKSLQPPFLPRLRGSGRRPFKAHVFSQLGLQKKLIEERVRFARARMGDYEVIDFGAMCKSHILSG